MWYSMDGAVNTVRFPVAPEALFDTELLRRIDNLPVAEALDLRKLVFQRADELENQFYHFPELVVRPEEDEAQFEGIPVEIVRPLKNQEAQEDIFKVLQSGLESYPARWRVDVYFTLWLTLAERIEKNRSQVRRIRSFASKVLGSRA